MMVFADSFLARQRVIPTIWAIARSHGFRWDEGRGTPNSAFAVAWCVHLRKMDAADLIWADCDAMGS